MVEQLDAEVAVLVAAFADDPGIATVRQLSPTAVVIRTDRNGVTRELTSKYRPENRTLHARRVAEHDGIPFGLCMFRRPAEHGQVDADQRAGRQQSGDHLEAAANHPAHHSRNRAPGEFQIILVDTPGLHRPRTLLGKRLNDLVRDTYAEVDVIGLCIPADEAIDRVTGGSSIRSARSHPRRRSSSSSPRSTRYPKPGGRAVGRGRRTGRQFGRNRSGVGGDRRAGRRLIDVLAAACPPGRRTTPTVS